MPTGENTEPAGGRVTRSLRKRLTSIDSDVPSRPGTPNNIILQTIPESNTPKKRVTRRASLSTPSALTPTIEGTNTPGLRVTRRRSVNFSESDEQSVQIIAREPTIAVVKEEEPEIETPNEKPKRVLRSSSKSPNDPENTKKSKQLSKKTTNQEEQEEPEVVIVLDDTIESQASKQSSAKKKTKANGSTPTKKSANLSAVEKNDIKNDLSVKTPSPNRKDSENIKDKKRSGGAGIESPVKSASKRDSIRANITPETSKSDKSSGRKSKSAEKYNELSNVKSSPLVFEKIETSQESPSKKNLSKIAAEPGKGRLSLTNKKQSSPARVKPAQNCPLKKTHPEPLKNVAFNEAADENTVKNVYPKTPGLIKSKSYILDASNDFDRNETFKPKKGQSFEDKGTNSYEEETASPNTKTPYKLKLMAVESSTPIQNSSPKQNKTSEIQKQKDKSAKENLMAEEGVVAFPFLWNNSVSGTSRETSKIDCILSEKSLQEKRAQVITNKSTTSQNNSKNKVRQDESDISETEDDMLEEDEFNDEEEKDQNEKKKTIFLDDDEAIEVANGQAFMDSKENKVTVENSKPIKKNSPKQNKTSKIQKQKEKSVEFGTIRETSKIDCNRSEKSLPEKRAQNATNKSPRNASKNKSKNKVCEAESDVSEDDLLEDDDDEFSYEEEKDRNAEKTIFLDDEAMEVADGQGPTDSDENKVSVEKIKPTPKNSPKQNKTSKIQEQKDKSEILMAEKEKEGAVAFPTSWTTSVSGTIRETSKIDCILSEKSLQEKRAQKATSTSPKNASKISSKNKVRRIDSDFSEAEDDMLEEDDDEFNDEEENNRKSRKSTFLDDEAMEVADGEESMDSEERAYLEENEVPEYGESIGSQDSEEDDNCDAEEPDEDDVAFVVSDTEVLEEFLSSEDEVETSKKKKLDTSKQKKYKRISQPSESSDEELNPPDNNDDTDFCLLVDSSLEEENAKQSVSGNVKSPKKSLNNKANDSDIEQKSVKNKSLKEDSKLNNSKINKTVQEDVSDKENETEKGEAELSPKIPNEKNISKNVVANKSEAKNDADIENNLSKEKVLKKETKLNSSKLNQTVQDNNSEIDDISQENEQEQSVLKSSEKKKLTKSPREKSITPVNISGNEEHLNDISRKSLNEKDNSPSESKSSSKSTKKGRKISTISVEDSDDVLHENQQESTASKLPPKKRLTKSPKRKSIALIAQDESEDEMQCNSTENSRKAVNKSIVCDNDFESINEKSLDQSRKSVSASIDVAANEESLDVSQRKPIDNSNSNKNASLNEEKENSKGRKSLNESRKSLIRTSTEETNDPGDQSTADKLKLLLEETLSASENQLDTSAGKSLNKSKDLRKSFDQNSSLQNEQSNQPEKSKRRKSIAQESIIEKASESSADSEEENKEKLRRDSLQNKEFNQLEKSKRRKSITQQSMIQKSSESSANSEDDSLQNKQSNQPEKSKRRMSIAQQSFIEEASESSADAEEQSKEKLRRESLQNKQSKQRETSKRRKSISQQSFIEKASESSADSEDDSLQNKQSNQPEKSKRRKSTTQQSFIDKASESSADSENAEKSSTEITDNEMESSHDEAAEAQFSDEENVATEEEEHKSEISLKQNSSRRKSIVTNESKLDETFQLDPKSSLSSSLHDSLHRTILRKSLNQSQKRKETIEPNTDDINKEDNLPTDSEEGDNSSEEEELEIKKRIVSEKGLSVSLNAIQIKKKKLKDTKAIRNSFTIGVSVRKNSSKDEDSSEAEPLAENAASSESEDPLDDQDSSSSESKLLNLSEENILENVKDYQQVGPYKSRKSMSNSILLAPPSDGDVNKKKRIKRTSLYLQEEAASNSFVENLAEEKKKIKQQKRKSNSFCGVVAPSAEDDDNDIRLKEPRSEKKLKKSSFESENKQENLNHVLSRCEQMIEAANEAKLKAKLQAKKVKVKKPKWMDKEEKEKPRKEEDDVEIPLVSKKEIKRKEKIKKQLAKALKQSASVLSQTIEPVKKAKQKNAPSKLEHNNVNPSKRLETEFLESLMELSNPNKKKAKEIETTPPSDKENSKKKSNKSKYRIEDIHKKIESDIETLETACGTVIVEPSTPKKLRFQHGFRESPKTPIGFKIQNIDSTDKKTDKKCSRKLKTLSGAFVEEDLTTSKKTYPLEKKARKRKLPRIEEPTYTLPKTQWTPSGVFVEEDLSNGRPLANSTATQFLVASLNSSKKNKTSSEVISSKTLDKALSFKQNALLRNKSLRQPSREILHVKHRKIVNSQF